jgi:hypothetical protein
MYAFRPPSMNHTNKYEFIPESTRSYQNVRKAHRFLPRVHFSIGGMAGVRELVREGQETANGVIKKATQTVYKSSFKKFVEFCLANGYPDPHTERHHELPAVLVAYLQSISASSTVSLQTAEKARSAVANKLQLPRKQRRHRCEQVERGGRRKLKKAGIWKSSPGPVRPPVHAWSQEEESD